MLVEFGTEMNGDWFSWNGVWNGSGRTGGYGDKNEPDGPERFRDTYRYIIDVCRIEGAENISWVFHVNGLDSPNESWNKFENYYPGDDYIDWLAVSIYGAQTPFEKDWPDFESTLKSAYSRLTNMALGKPVIVAEFGMTGNYPKVNAADWTTLAFKSIKDLAARKNSHLIGFSWWNEGWWNNDDPSQDTNMRVQDNPAIKDVFNKEVAGDSNVLGEIPLQP
jgi:beta-mannanase